MSTTQGVVEKAPQKDVVKHPIFYCACFSAPTYILGSCGSAAGIECLVRIEK